MHTPRIVVVGSSNTGLVVRADRLPRPGETILGGDLLITPGGKGANQAVAAARLGAQVHLIARLGTDFFGDHAEEMLGNMGVDLSGMVRDPDAASGVALITVDAHGQNAIVVAPGANYRLGPQDLLQARELLAAADLILCQNEIPAAAIDCVCQLARELGRPMLLNPAPITAQGIPPAWLRAASVLVPNQVEAAHLLGRPIATPEAAREAARGWVAEGIPVVIITLGSGGVVAATAEGDCHLPALPVTPVDTVGAGDCFIGALAFALCSGQELQEALAFANAAAALAVTRPGAQQSMPYRLEVEALLGDQPGPQTAGTPRLSWRLSL